jgi:AcrR family transcriptional regulator
MADVRQDKSARKKAPTRGRVGRPRLDQVGDVDLRLLHAARELFLEQGYERTGCEQVAERAGAGKASLYARYPNKTALFAAVVGFELEKSRVTVPGVSAQLPLADRLASAARVMLELALEPSAQAFLRLLIGEAQHLPDLAREAGRVILEGRVVQLAQVIAGAQCSDPAALARASPAAALFVDLVFAPQQLRALLGQGPSSLAKDAEPRIALAIRALDKLELLAEWR